MYLMYDDDGSFIGIVKEKQVGQPTLENRKKPP